MNIGVMLSMTPTPDLIHRALVAAPPSTVLGLSVRDPRLRERSRLALAEFLAEQLLEQPSSDDRQLGLPL